ncbi:MAG: hypothetical protein ACOVK2_00595 [Candidatus Fonsibacter sp.]
METTKEYHNRRINEINERIEYLQSYIDNNTTLKHNENGVGGSYLNRRNSRISANHNQRVNEFKSEIEGLKRVVEMHINKLR